MGNECVVKRCIRGYDSRRPRGPAWQACWWSDGWRRQDPSFQIWKLSDLLNQPLWKMLHRSCGFSTHTLVINGDRGKRGWKVILVLHYSNYDIILLKMQILIQFIRFFSLNKTSILIQQGCIKFISKVTKDFYFKLIFWSKNKK